MDQDEKRNGIEKLNYKMKYLGGTWKVGWALIDARLLGTLVWGK